MTRPPAPKVRPAILADLPRLLSLFWPASRTMYERLGATRDKITAWERSNDWDAYWKRRIAEPDSHVLVVDDGSALAGMLGIIPLEPGAVGFVSIYTSRQQLGIGSALMKAALEAAAKQGTERVELSTATSNEAMQALARKFGFEPVGHFRHAPFPSAVFIHYVRKLT